MCRRHGRCERVCAYAHSIMVLNPSASIDGRLRERAAGVFAGREGELALFDAVLAPPLPAVSLLWIHGPGGIGKSTLLTQLREPAESGGRRTAFVDAASLAPAVAAFEAALGVEHPRFAGEPGVLFIDSAEALTPLQDWLRREFLPAMPATWLVVLAVRHPPPAHWTVDAGWQGLMQVYPLAPLSDPESRMLLARRGVPDAEQPGLLRWARGLPLALALLAATRLAGARGHDGLRDADVTNGTPTPMPTPHGEVVQALVRRFRLAQTLLRRDKPLKAVAPEVGYSSPAAFSRVFAKRVGASPVDWMATQRAATDKCWARDLCSSAAKWADRWNIDFLQGKS